MATLPEYLTEQTDEAILKRMLDSLPADLDKAEGSYIWDALSPAAIELALAATWAQEVLRRGFASTTFGEYLDLRCEEHGITRRAATKATGQVKFTGTASTFIPAGTRVATPADPASGAAAVEFATTADVTLDGTGAGYADVEAVAAGASGNVPAGAISILATPVAGISAVTNLAATAGGLDTEDDASLLARYLQRVRNPSAGGNKADYEAWAMEVAGVGGVSVVPVRDGPGTVSVAVINADKEPADQALVDAVQNYIAPPWVNVVETEAMTRGGYGVSVDTSQADDTGDSVKMVYSASGAGTITHALNSLLQQPGIWQARPRVKVDATAGATDLLQVGVYNLSMSSWAKTTPSGSTDAVITLKASDLATAFGEKVVQFAWNGQDQLELRITRLTTDTTTTAWVDQVVFRSTFSKDTGDGKAPVGARVTVESAGSVVTNVSATLTIASGYDPATVKAAAAEAIRTYIQSLAYLEDNDVRYVRIGQAILDTPGVQDYSNLLVNGATANVPVGIQEVAVPGVVSIT
ncbi:MAG: baseplate J/gp47 family protein [Bacillota bacterium]|nr:baseplate J/gp47 family protein [Bacillota bacterium]